MMMTMILVIIFTSTWLSNIQQIFIYAIAFKTIFAILKTLIALFVDSLYIYCQLSISVIKKIHQDAKNIKFIKLQNLRGFFSVNNIKVFHRIPICLFCSSQHYNYVVLPLESFTKIIFSKKKQLRKYYFM